MHSEKRAISLSMKKPSNQGSLVIVSGQDFRSDPCISSVCNCDHDYYFELLGEEERDTQSISRCLMHTIAMSGLSRVRTELVPLLVIPPLPPHPVQTNRQPAGHRYLGGFPST